ncbi:MAG: DegQ family serine endoprotease [Candidatus Methylomirabilales bacterium]
MTGRLQRRSPGRMGRVLISGIFAVALVVGIVGSSGDLGLPFQIAGPTPGAGSAVAASPARTVGQPGPDLTAVARAVMPAVVNIRSARIVRGPGTGPTSPYFSDPFFDFFFGEEFLRQFRVPREGHERSLGSGVLVEPEGILLTNHHVVAGATEVEVTLVDRREFSAEIVGTDPRTDLAVLRISGGPFPVLPLGDSDRVQVAEPVLAIGNPFGLSQTVTQGIISAVGRANVGITDYEDFLQTDAAINPGNSGGALVNARGELIGINTAIFTRSGGYMGIGFAIPVNMAKAVMQQILATGKVTRGWLGVSIQDVTPAVARAFGLGAPKGALVADIVADSPAANAGLQRGDVIVRLNGKAVNNVGHLRNLVGGIAPGTTVSLTLLRSGKEKQVVLTISEQPADLFAARQESAPLDPSTQLGLTVVDPTPELLRQLDLPREAQGALVRAVQPGSAAQEAGLQPGDLIQEVNRRPIRSAREFAETVRRQRGQDLVVLVNRGGSTAFLVVERPAKG